jgi:hypothetical protein
MDARLRDSFSDGLIASEELQRSVRGKIVRERYLRWAVAAAILIGAVMGYRALRPPRVLLDAALDHRREVVDHQPRRWRSDPAEIEKLAARSQLRGALAPAGYRLEHAKMCGIGGKPALHLVYTNGSREFSMFVRARTGEDQKARARSVDGEQVGTFETDRFEAIAVTDGSSAECSQFVRLAAAVL